MNKKLSVILALCSMSAFAGTDSFYIAIKANTMSMNYSESQNGATLDTEKSKFFGKIGGYNIDAYAKVAQGFLGADATRIIVNYEYDNGNSNYVGSALGSNQPYGSVANTTQNTVKRLQGMVSQVKYTSYGQALLNLGFGNRTWNRGLSSSQTEDYIWNYWIAGLGFDFNIGSSFTLGALGYYQRALSPQMKYNDSSNNLNFNLSTTSGYRFEIPLSYKITDTFGLVGAWTYDNWKISGSNSIKGFSEPPSTTNNQILSLGVSAKF